MRQRESANASTRCNLAGEMTMRRLTIPMIAVMTTLAGVLRARDGAITLLDPSGTAVARWTFSRGRPTEWRGPTLDAANVSVALEELEIVHEGLKWEDPERTEGADA